IKKNKQLEKFTYIASHDLKTPIRNITNFTNLVERNLKAESYDQAQVLQDLAYIKNNAQQMTALVEDILQISTLDYSDQDAKTTIKLTQVATQAKEALLQQSAYQHADVQIADLPTYYGNASEFYLIFQNLIQNGIKYNQNKTPQIRIWATQTDTTIYLHVRDNGIGIKPEFQSQVFEFFKRLHTREEYEGTGLGLGLCKRIVEGYQGEITLESTPGAGSTFTICLPRK
ncbi:MAG: GHKL domain-containing protein, partial [Bacteroidetes bacterium]